MIRRWSRRVWGTSIRRQLVLGVAIVHLGLMTVFVFDLVQRQKHFLVERAREHALRRAELLAMTTVHEVLASDVAGLAEVVMSVSRDRTIRYAFVVDAEGRVLGHSHRTRAGEFLADPQSLAVLTGPARAQVLSPGKDGSDVVAAAPVRVGERPIGWAFVAADLSADRAHLSYVTKAGLMYTLVAIAIGTVFALLLARAITRPLQLLLAGTRRVGADQLDHPIVVRTNNEVGVVSHAFNRAMQRLAAQRSELSDALVRETAARAEAEAAMREVRQLNEQLEERVMQRTAELQGALTQLETFSYSVSHDLRAPLRAMDGFSQALVEDYQDKLDATGQDFLQRIRSASQRMAQMIDDMLTLSQVTRRELRRMPFDLSSAAREVLVEARGSAREQNKEQPPSDAAAAAEVQVQDGIVLEADPQLMRQVLENLLTNALKFSRNRRPPRIEVGVEETASGRAVYVRDNGTGFDMKYADKLFRPFQRLHLAREFEGTGVGLATVQRIIQRHGGRVWVQAEKDKGATFYFTVPTPAPEPE